MKTGLAQTVRLGQELKINPRLYQAMDMLYMPLLDLQTHLKQELLVNPFLELSEDEELEIEERQEEEQEQDQEQDSAHAVLAGARGARNASPETADDAFSDFWAATHHRRPAPAQPDRR